MNYLSRALFVLLSLFPSNANHVLTELHRWRIVVLYGEVLVNLLDCLLTDRSPNHAGEEAAFLK